jgi:hypothetical protein
MSAKDKMIIAEISPIDNTFFGVFNKQEHPRYSPASTPWNPSDPLGAMPSI